MKTLGQIAYEGAHPTDYSFDMEGARLRMQWEAAAQAVRAAVIEECAKRIEGEYRGAIAYSGKWEAEIDDIKAEVNRELVQSIRSLK